MMINGQLSLFDNTKESVSSMCIEGLYTIQVSHHAKVSRPGPINGENLPIQKTAIYEPENIDIK